MSEDGYGLHGNNVGDSCHVFFGQIFYVFAVILFMPCNKQFFAALFYSSTQLKNLRLRDVLEVVQCGEIDDDGIPCKRFLSVFPSVRYCFKRGEL